jgi:hypothetical protein
VAQSSRPTPDNGRVVTDDDYENLTLGYSVDGLIGNTSDTYPVFADSTGRQVKIRAAKKAIVRGYLWRSDPAADEIVATTTNTSGNPRIDRLVLQLDRATRNVRTVLKTGSPSASPVAPSLTQNSGTSSVWEFPIARWQIASGYTTITAADVVPDGWYLAPPSGIAWQSTWTQPAGSALRIGQYGFETNTGFSYRYNGKWLRNEDEQLVTNDQAWTSTTSYSGVTPANLTPNRSLGFGFPVAANSRYSFEARLQIIGPASVGLAVRTTMPANARLDIALAGYTATGGWWVGDYGTVTVSPNVGGVFGAGATPPAGLVRIGGVVTTGVTAGNFVFEFTQGTSNATSAWLLVGSSLTHRQIS